MEQIRIEPAEPVEDEPKQEAARAVLSDWADIITPNACAASRAFLVQRPLQILARISEGA